MVRFLSLRRWDKRNRSNFYWGVVKVCVGSIKCGVIFLSEFLVKIFWINLV